MGTLQHWRIAIVLFQGRAAKETELLRPFGSDDAATPCTVQSVLSCGSAETGGAFAWLRRNRGKIALALFALTLLAGAYYLFSERGDDFVLDPNLPEHFAVEYRIPKNRGQVYQPKGPIARESKYDQAWLDAKFTHYIESNAFVWAKPKKVFPCDGKIWTGHKVILGPHVNGFDLICTLTDSGKVENMFVVSGWLRARAAGPPPPPRNDD